MIELWIWVGVFVGGTARAIQNLGEAWRRKKLADAMDDPRLSYEADTDLLMQLFRFLSLSVNLAAGVAAAMTASSAIIVWLLVLGGILQIVIPEIWHRRSSV